MKIKDFYKDKMDFYLSTFNRLSSYKSFNKSSIEKTTNINEKPQ